MVYPEQTFVGQGPDILPSKGVAAIVVVLCLDPRNFEEAKRIWFRKMSPILWVRQTVLFEC